MDNKQEQIKLLMSGEYNTYGTQGVYSDVCSIYSPKGIKTGEFFSSEYFISQEYLSNFENSYNFGAINATGSFMASYANMLSLFGVEYNEEIDNTKTVKLPTPRHIKMSIEKAIRNRHSSRSFNEQSVSLQELSDILFYSYGSLGKTQEMMYGNLLTRHKRPIPSGGGMYSLNLYIVSYNVDKIPSHIYQYQPISHTLFKYAPIKDLDNFIVTSRYDANSGEYKKIEKLNPAVLIVVTNNFAKQRIKYSELSLLLALTDSGALCQNVGLLSSSLDLNCCVWAGFKKRNIEKLLSLDGLDSHCLMTILIGNGE